MKFHFLPYLAISFFALNSIFAQEENGGSAPAAPEAPPVKTLAETYQEQVDSASRLLEEVQKELAKSPETVDLKDKSALSMDKIREEKSKVEADLSAARGQGEILASRDAERTSRMARLPSEIAEIRAKMTDLPSNSESEKQKLEDLKKTLDLLELEQKSYTATSTLFTSKQELNRRQITILEKKQRAWQRIFDAKHAEETELARQNAEAAAARFSTIPAIASLAEGNAEIAKNRQSVSKKAAKTETRLARNLQYLKEIQEQRATARDRITLLESANLRIDTETGKLLRIQRKNLPQRADLTLDLQATIKASASAQIAVLEVRKALADMPIDLGQEAERLLKEADSPGLKAKDIERLLIQKQTSLRNLTTDYSLYIDALNKVSAAIRKLRTEQQLYSKYLDERLLWIPSADPIAVGDLEVERRAITRLLSADQIGAWVSNLLQSPKEHPFSWIIFIVSFNYLIIRRKRFHKTLEKSAELAQRRSTTSIIPTFKALAATLFLALPLGMLFIFLGWRVPIPPDIGRAFFICGFFFFFIGTFLRMTAKNGFLRFHVRMENHRVDRLYWHLRWYFAATPVVLFFFLSLPGTGAGAQAGRLFFILLLLLQLTLFHCIFRPSVKMVPGSKWLGSVIWLIATIIPITFIVGIGIGYISSVNTLRQQTMASVGLILIGLLVSKILERWILLSRRRLALEIAHKKYQARMEDFRKKSDDDEQTAPSLDEFEEHETDLVTVEAQTKKLLRLGMSVVVVFGILSIWASSLPALSFLDKIELWGGDSAVVAENQADSGPASALTGMLDSSDPAAEGDAQEASLKQATTLQDLIMAGLVVALFLAAARNLPGLLELSLLRRLNLRPGGNYAITTILKYVLVAIGFLISFGLLGMTWSSVQWLAAAITLGIGFGLQEIFANFVAGIILLFERPIRLGDIVTVSNDISGRVTKIEIRATTIQQFNQRELIVPNKEFITGSLINWTLTNNMQRFEIPVGIAYGSDTKLATKILKKILASHPKILKDPAPEVLFVAFGASTLDFAIRGYVAHLDDFVSTQSEIHYQIDQEFRKAEIDIAIPQRDIFIRSLPESLTNPLAELSKKAAPREEKE